MSDFIGGSGERWGGKGRTPQQRVDAMAGAIEAGKAMLARIAEAEGDASRLALLMCESIAMWRASRGLSTVGRDGRKPIDMEAMQAAYCCDAARAAYLRAVGANHE